MQNLLKFILIILFVLSFNYSIYAGDSGFLGKGVNKKAGRDLKELMIQRIAGKEKSVKAPVRQSESSLQTHKTTLLSQKSKGRRKQTSAFIKEIKFTGNTVIGTETLKKQTDEFINKELSLDEMRDIADLITELYNDKGYILSRAYLPPQKIKDGILTIAIVEAKLGKIAVEENTYYHDRVYKLYFKRLQNQVLDESLITRAILHERELPGVKSTDLSLKGSDKPNVADGVLTARDSFPIKWTIDYNNFGNKLISEDRYGSSLEITDPWLGTTLALRGVTGNTFQDSAMGSVDYTMRINSYGTTLTASYLKGLYGVGQELADLGLEGWTEIYGGKIKHPLIKDRSKELSVSLGYASKWTRDEIDKDTVRAIDHLDVYGLSFDFDSMDRYLGKNIASLGYFTGDIRQHTDIADPSREDSGKHFARFSLNVARVQKIPYGDNTILLLRASGQTTDDRLLPVEQTVLGGYGTVRGHAPSQFLGDSGYNVSSEIMFAPFLISDKKLFGQTLGQMIQFACFFDHGGVFITESKPEPTEYESEYLSGYGGGVRLFYKDFLTFKFDVGFPTHRTENDDDHYLYFSISLSPLKVLDFF